MFIIYIRVIKYLRIEQYMYPTVILSWNAIENLILLKVLLVFYFLIKQSIAIIICVQEIP